MEQSKHIADKAALSLLGQRIAQHRLEQNRTQAELAHEAGVSKRTIERLEGGESIHTTNLVRVLRVLGLPLHPKDAIEFLLLLLCLHPRPRLLGPRLLPSHPPFAPTFPLPLAIPAQAAVKAAAAVGRSHANVDTRE